MSNSKNDEAWNKLFDKYKISEKIHSNGHYKIRSSEIKEFREPRLMAKFDYKSKLPKIFLKNNFSILPVSRSSYIISDFEIFQNFENGRNNIKRFDFPGHLESLDFKNITTESVALNCAYVSGIIEDFVQDNDLKPTVCGRMSSSVFDFNINRKGNQLLEVHVDNAQIEIDGGYEGSESLSLIEVKNSISEDFLVRQIFYPYKLWSNKVSKEVKPLFLTYSNGIFHFREYKFEDSNHYNSLRLIREEKYAARGEPINIEHIQNVLQNVKIINEPFVPFPQADCFERVINLCELLNNNKELSRDDITNKYDFDSRQTSYYTDAGRYLGLIDKKEENGEIFYFLTKSGEELFDLSILERQKRFIELILSHSVFNKTLSLYFKKGKPPIKNEVVKIMKKSNLFNVKEDSTFYRRSSTILSWIEWILEQMEE